jgi:hypothetical protein
VPRTVELTDAEKAAIVAGAREGKSAPEIARQIARGAAVVRKFARTRGLELRKGVPALSDDELLQIEELAHLGYTQMAIAKATGRSDGSVSRYLKRMGIAAGPVARRRTCLLKFDDAGYFLVRAEAGRRGMSVRKFLYAVIACVVGSNLTGAVLDHVERDGPIAG